MFKATLLIERNVIRIQADHLALKPTTTMRQPIIEKMETKSLKTENSPARMKLINRKTSRILPAN